MQNVKVDRSRLLSTLKQNRAAHLAAYNEAMLGFRAEVQRTLEKHLALAKKGKDVPHHLGLVIPANNLKDYDRAIKMAEFSTEQVIVLTEEEFAQYVLDDWQWKEMFANTTMSYSGAANFRKKRAR